MRVSEEAVRLGEVDPGGGVLVGPVLVRGAGGAFGIFGEVGSEVTAWVVIFPGPCLDVSDFSFQERRPTRPRTDAKTPTVRGWICRHGRIRSVAETVSLLHVHQLDRATLSTECQEPFQSSVNAVVDPVRTL
jgi:hypothetical protein